MATVLIPVTYIPVCMCPPEVAELLSVLSILNILYK